MRDEGHPSAFPSAPPHFAPFILLASNFNLSTPMPFNPALPTELTLADAAQMRGQLNGLKDLIDAVPAGPAGPQGDPGPQGPPFSNAVVDGVSTLNPGDSATVSTSFDGTNVHFTFGIPHGTPGSDGMKVDSVGRLYVTTRVGLQMFDPTGRLGGTILKPHAGPLSNVCFGGKHLDTLYVTAGDKVYKRRVQATGVRYAKLK